MKKSTIILLVSTKIYQEFSFKYLFGHLKITFQLILPFVAANYVEKNYADVKFKVTPKTFSVEFNRVQDLINFMLEKFNGNDPPDTQDQLTVCICM